MFIEVLKSKIHRVKITQAELHYVGSITLDEDLMDAANIIEGSQGIVHAEMQGEDLYFSATLPNIIVGTVGNGKQHDFVRENLAMLGCHKTREPGMNARRLAAICAATVLCGELSLLAAQTNPGELMRSHVSLERKESVPA